MMKARKAEYTDKLGRTWKWNGEKYVYQRKTDRKEREHTLKSNTIVDPETGMPVMRGSIAAGRAAKARVLAEKMRGNVDPFTGSAKIESMKATQVASPSEVKQVKKELKGSPERVVQLKAAAKEVKDKVAKLAQVSVYYDPNFDLVSLAYGTEKAYKKIESAAWEMEKELRKQGIELSISESSYSKSQVKV